MRDAVQSALSRLARMGYVTGPTPVERLPDLEVKLGLRFFGIKRDDRLPALLGGTKPRKLDFLLAREPFRSEKTWTSIGAIGSGSLTAIAEACRQEGRHLDARCFAEPLSPEVLNNLAFTAGAPATLRFHRTMTQAAWSELELVRARDSDRPIIPAGATTPLGMLGMVAAAFELEAQVAAGVLPAPDRIYLSYGSGGTTAGLSVGLALAGVSTTLIAVSATPRLAANHHRRKMLEGRLRSLLAKLGVDTAQRPSTPVRLVHRQLGAGYGAPTPAGRAACELLAELGFFLEPVYTGKAMAALLEEAPGARGSSCLFWLTAHRGPLKEAPDWREHLPKDLARWLNTAEKAAPSRRWITRRGLLIGGGVGATAAALATLRLAGGPGFEGWSGKTLSPEEGQVLVAAAQVYGAFIDDELAKTVAANIDRFLEGMPEDGISDVHALLGLVQHGTLLGGHLARFTELDVSARRRVLARLSSLGGPLAIVPRALLNLVFVGYYQEPASWAAIGYEGPRVASPRRTPELPVTPWPDYDALRAPPRALPKGMRP